MHAALLAILTLLQAQDDPIQNLQHKHPDVRRAGAVVIGVKSMHAGILPLIHLLKDEPNNDVRMAARDSLKLLSGKDFADRHADWLKWWDTEGTVAYPRQILTDDRVRQLFDPYKQELDGRLKEAIAEKRVLTTLGYALAILFFLVMLYFVGHVSSRLKEWKEIASKAEVYIKKAEEVTLRTDQIIAEIDAKKLDVMAFFNKTREDSQGEMERFVDNLQKNMEHKQREEMMALRQKAEKEIGQTLGDLRAQVEVEIRRMASDQKDKTEKVLGEQREQFLKEVDAHTLFLEASFYSIHGKHEDAVRRYRKLVELKPDHLLAWNNLGTVYRELVRYDESLDAYTKALAIAPNNPSVLYNVAATYARLHRRDKMLESLALAVANDGEFKDEALNDPAFREYWNDPAFKDLAEA